MRAETVQEERKAKMLTEPLMPLAQPQVLPWIKSTIPATPELLFPASNYCSLSSPKEDGARWASH